ncbi:amino acid adenylation domain-containing protein, partial [Streptomyces sp. NPDC020330]|uniref:amino acid adenylation domain-containing protein n=1 Tax=unclassified Streptomyces TaxID=2593676 RepID=UPI0037984091
MFAEVLGLESVAADANFFDLGGDSIISIQLVGAARKFGLVLTPRDIFRLKTVEALAAVAVPADDLAPRAERAEDGIGEFTPAPIVHWLRERGGPIAGFSQSTLLQVPAELTTATLTDALQTVLDHHDALRTRLARAEHDAGWRLTVAPQGQVRAEELVLRVPTAGLTDHQRSGLIAEQTGTARAGLDPEAGTMLRAVWFDAGPDTPGRLLLMLHHLVVDGVSWRILLPDLEQAWRAASEGAEPTLQPVGTSLRRWSQQLAEQSGDPALHAELPLWREILATRDPLLTDRPLDAARDTAGTGGTLTLELPADRTEALLTRVPAAFHAGVNDVLLTGLSLAVAAWRRERGLGDSPELLVDLEGHGRDPFVAGMDLSRTVGWFTSLFPVRLDPGPVGPGTVPADDPAIGTALKRVKEQLASVPGKGLGYGRLRYLDPRTGPELAGFGRPQIGFNYLGRFTAAGAGEGRDWTPAAEAGALGGGSDDALPLAHTIEVNALTEDRPDGPRLLAHWSWARELLTETDVRELADGWFRALETLVAHADLPGAGGRTPSDFPHVTLDQSEVDELEAAHPGLTDVLPLAPLQEGLLFHSVYDDRAPDVYQVQFFFELSGALDRARLRRAAEALLARHESLRAVFRHAGTDRPVQVVLGEAVLPWREHDLTDLAPAERAAAVARLAEEDRAVRFDLTAAPLLRLTVAGLDGDTHLLMLTNHHIILDGWSMPALVQELLALYDQDGATDGLHRVTPYRDYLAWLAGRDRAAAEEAWRTALEGVEEPTLLVPAPEAHAPVPPELLMTALSEEFTAALTRRARSLGLTLNTLVQGAWAVLLARLTGRDDVVFGTTVSGRPDDLPGIETTLGLFINTLPVRVRLREEETVRELLTRIQDEQSRLLGHHHLGLADIRRLTGADELFDTLAVFENYPEGYDSLRSPSGDLRVTGVDGRDATHYPLTLTAIPGAELRLRLGYRADVFGPDEIERIALRLRRLLEAVEADPARTVARLDVLEPAERHQVVTEWNDTAHSVSDTTVTELIEAQVARTPDATALVDGAVRLSYAELNARANRLARLLVGRGVAPGQLVALALPRSADLVVCVLAVLKSGAGYLPVETDYPADRISYLLTDAAPTLVITDSVAGSCLPGTDTTPRLALDGAGTRDALAGYAAGDLTDADRVRPLSTLHPAYVIYTSGSTGRPKGVVTEHRALSAYIQWARDTYRSLSGTALLHSPVSFDLTVTALFGPLTVGGRVHVTALEDDAPAPAEAGPCTFLKVTPSHLALLAALPERFSPSGEIVVGGEQLRGDVMDEWRAARPGAAVINEYGPTETTVGCIEYRVLPEDSVDPGPVAIGRPVWNTRVYILDQGLRPVPAGVNGELYIAGSQLARGYLGRPGLTAGRFVADPFDPAGGRMYRTGDVARWRADGLMEFLGRIDDQVKIRGHRIELGEIEAVLADHPQTGHVAVIDREDQPGRTRLVAYVVPAGGTADHAELRAHVERELPEYMVPSAFVSLDALPLTANGKLDRKALPAPQQGTAVAAKAAGTAVEELLSTLFAEVLGVASVGVDESFFELGGDSIVSIQLVSRARKAGLTLTPRDVFEHKTVEALAAMADDTAGTPDGTATVVSDEGIGAVPLTPAVHWLRELNGPVDGFSQAALLKVPAELGAERLAAALQAVLDHHDALRLRLTRIGGVVWGLAAAERGAVGAADLIQRVSVEGLDEDALRATVDEHTRAARELLSPEAGSLVRAVWFDAGPDRAGRLLLVVHHLAVDGVSWRILLPDLAEAWQSLAEGGQPALAPVGTSFRRWAERLSELAQDPARMAETTLWAELLAGVDPLLGDRPLDRTRDVAGNARTLSLTLPASVTAPLLTEAPAVYRGRVNDILLTGLALAVADWRRARGAAADTTGVLVELEGHGREETVADAELTRTVGWFTSTFPVRLDAGRIDADDLRAGGTGAPRAVDRIKELLGALPDNGLGYGLLRHLNPQTGPMLAQLPKPQIGFNYLGRFTADETFGSTGWSTDTQDGLLGGSGDPQMPFAHSLEISALTEDHPDGPRLTVTWIWPDGVFTEDAVRELADGWFRSLKALATHAARTDSAELTPADLPLVDLTASELTRLRDGRPELADVLPLAPLQEGLLFHSLYDQRGQDPYNVQLLFELTGPMDGTALRAAAEQLLRRHPNLGAGFVHEGLEEPVQLLFRELPPAYQEYDLCGLDDAAREAEQERILDEDRARRFDLSAPPLIRFTLLRLGAERSRLAITNHHILLDGWSTPLLVRELFALYGQHEGAEGLPAVRPYRDYLAWLTEQDRAAAQEAWRQALDGIAEPTLLAPDAAGRPATVPDRVTVEVPKELTARLADTARRNGLTVNTVVQGLWAMLLSRRTGKDDVVFGATVSGRPAELDGFESMVGLFINTLPVRVTLDPAESVLTLLARVQAEQTELMAHHHLGLTEVQRLAGQGELFDTLAVFENYPLDPDVLQLPGTGLSVADVEMRNATHYTMSLVVIPGNRLELSLDYRPDLVTRQDAEHTGAHLLGLLRQVVEAPGLPVGRVNGAPDGIETEISLPVVVGGGVSLGELFAEQVVRSPGAVAVVCGD